MIYFKDGLRGLYTKHNCKTLKIKTNYKKTRFLPLHVYAFISLAF